MEFPDEILALIREFARPVTRPGWRRLRKMTSYNFHRAILYKYNRMRHTGWCKVIYHFVDHYTRYPQDKFIYVFESYLDDERRLILAHLKLNPDYPI